MTDTGNLAPAEAAGATRGFLMGLSHAASTFGLYPAEHPRARQALGKLQEAFAVALTARQTEEVTLLLVDDDLAVDHEPWQRGSVYAAALRKAMTRARVERLTLQLGVTGEELADLLQALAGAYPATSGEHIQIGRLAIGDSSDDGFGAGLEGRIDALRDGLDLLAEDLTKGFAQLERTLWQVLETTAQQDRTFALLAGFREDGQNERLWRHSINVGLLAIHHGRALGLAGEALHGLGVGALLHDIGYLDFEGRMPSPALRRRHPELGARRLAAIEGMAEVPILVAFEHHLAWDGRGGYPESAARRPGLAAQITAVADCWDMVLQAGATLPYPARHDLAVAELQRRAGAMLDPFLVASFVERTSATE
ncbi:MAG: HD domain-containing protein [Acidobacteriota bacterium]